MKRKKIIITLCSIIFLIFLDFIVALLFNSSPVIKIRDYYNNGTIVYKDKGIFTNTYKCSDNKIKTVLKTSKYECSIKNIKEDKKKETITITFDTKGGSKMDNITINKGTELTLPKDPTFDGYVFTGWVDKNETPIYDKTLLAEDTTLYAVWEKVEDKNTNPKTEKIKTNTNNTNTSTNKSNQNTNTNTNKPNQNTNTNTNKPNQNTNNNTNTNKPNQNTNTSTNKPNQNTNNNTNIVLPEKKPPVVVEKTQAEKNDEYRKQLQNKYSVKIAYKDEMGNYSMNGYSSVRLYDDTEINTYLAEIDKALNKYPKGFFKEIKDYNMPLTIYLVKSISGNVSGVTDAQYKNNIKIMIEPALLFESTLHHEIMHYIDSYISVKGYPIDINSTMKDVNPVGFSYGDKSNDYIYYSTNANDAYFLSVYGKTNYLEDRAVIFSDLMFRSFTKDCYADGTPINKKAKLISSQIKSHFKTLSNTGRYYWDRFI